MKGFQVKLATNIHHANGKKQRFSRSYVKVKFKVIGNLLTAPKFKALLLQLGPMCVKMCVCYIHDRGIYFDGVASNAIC